MKSKCALTLTLIVFMIGLVILISYLTGNKKEETTMPSPSTLVSDQVDLLFKSFSEDTGTLEIIIRNNTTDTLYYGEGFSLDKYENDVWTHVPEIESAYDNLEGIVLSPNEENVIRIVLGESYDYLSAGTYRLTKDIYGFGNVSVLFQVNCDQLLSEK